MAFPDTVGGKDYANSPFPSTLPKFNPSGDARVTDIKQRTEELMAYVRGCDGDERCKSIAITNYEQAAMWAVKSLFVK